MITAIVILFAVCFLLAISVAFLYWYTRYLKDRHNELVQAFLDYSDGITKVFASLRVVTIREKQPAETVFRVEAPKGVQ